MTSFSGAPDVVELQKLLASDPASSDFFGESVAISSDGLIAVIGADSENTSPNNDNGAAYVFTREIESTTWTQQQKLLASDAASSANFGNSVSISGDGNIIIIGALNATVTAARQGAAYVFTRSGTTWTQQQILVASDAAETDFFGRSVAISSDSSTVIIGASNDGSVPVAQPGSGSAYIFTRSGASWNQQAKLTASDAAQGDTLGSSVAISSNGNTAIISSGNEDTSPNSNNGAAYVFTRSGTTWTQQQKLLASDAAAEDYFGESVALSADGNTAIIGAYTEDTSPNTNNGAAYVFTRSGSTWTQQQKLLASDAASSDTFGQSVSLSADGNTAIIGAPFEDASPNSNNGAAYVFTRSGTTWTQQKQILASDRQDSDYFGYSVAISSDGSTVIIGAHYEDTSLVTQNGAAYVYALGKTLDNKFYSYNPTTGSWYISFYWELKSPTSHSFTSSGNFIIPLGAKVIEVTCIGAGGGGGGGARNIIGDGGGSGGGGGGLSKYLFRVQDLGGVDASITITIGTGGAGGAATASGTTALNGNSGTSGGATSFGSYLQATGGNGGGGGNGFTGNGGAGGRGMFYGNQGGGFSLNSASIVTGAGGGGGGGVTYGVGSKPTAFNIAIPSNSGDAGFSNATLKGPGTGGNGSTSSTGTPSVAGAGGLYGGGGGGGGEGSTAGATASGGAGGAGANGVCIIRIWYG